MSSSSEATLLSPLWDAGVMHTCLRPPEECLVKLGEETQIQSTVVEQCKAVYC